MSIQQMLLGASGASGYLMDKSLRFRASASAYLNRTMGTPTNNKIWTISTWVKRGTLSSGALQSLFVANAGGSAYWGISFTTTDNLYIFDGFNATSTVQTTAVYRDPAAWYHIVVAVDTTQATASNRFKLYVNGSQVTAFSTATYPAINLNTQWNTASGVCSIGRDQVNGRYFDGYLADVNFIDGQALTPASFGSTNALTGVWQPKAYTGTYGTNGFYLDFETTTSVAALGNDKSGNGNTWTVNNISLTAGVTYDSMTDVPTLTSATAANFAVMNAVAPYGSFLTLTEANLKSTCNGAYWAGSPATIGVSSGKWYWEVTVSNLTGNLMVGITKDTEITGTSGINTYPGITANSYGYSAGGQKYNNATITGYGASYTTNDVIGVALDMDAGTLTFYKNNTLQGTAFSSLSGTYLPSLGVNTSPSALIINFGQRPFAYTPPTGFVALNTFNLPTSTILKGNTVMDATLYTGNGSTQTITNSAGFQPDLVWIKNRNNVRFNILTDSVRGTNSQMFSNDTSAQESRTDRLTAFNSNGFSVGSYIDVNNNADTFVAWQWKANGAAVSNTSGTITSQISVNASAGFSVVTYTGNGTAGATVGHGLGVAPKLVIVKKRNGVQEWMVGSSSLTSWNNYLVLNTTAAQAGATTIWNDTAPTSSVFSLGSSTNTNGNTNTFVAYCFAEIDGFSKFGSYTGNGSADGPFVYLGFRPKFVMAKRTNSTSNWNILDSGRDLFNATGKYIYANTSDAEGANASTLDLTSNGFKIRQTYTDWNASGSTYIYMAFAESPFRNSLAR